MGRSSNRCYLRPYIAVDQWVMQSGKYNYPGWPREEYRQVKEIVHDEDNGCYSLRIWNPKKTNGAGWSLYSPNNFFVVPAPLESEEHEMAKEQTNDRFFAIKLNRNPEDVGIKQEDVPHALSLGYDENGGFHLADVNTNHEVDENHYDTTPLRDSRTKVTNDVRDIIKHGERWVLCEAIAFIDGEPPRPPIKLVELR